MALFYIVDKIKKIRKCSIYLVIYIIAIVYALKLDVTAKTIINVSVARKNFKNNISLSLVDFNV